MLKVLIILLSFCCHFAFAEGGFSKFDVIEIKANNNEKSSFVSKNKSSSKFGIVLSGNNYNQSSKTLIVAPVTLKTKEYKGRFIFSFKSGGKEYIIFTDKLRNISKSNAGKSFIVLKPQEKEEIQKQLSNVLN